MIFERSSLSKIKGFKDLDSFDDFIQKALDKYNFTNSTPKLDESSEKFHDYIINEESLIPDLIIYNKTFNKNECYFEYYDYGFNKYPRKKFVLNAKKEEEETNKNKETKNKNEEENILEKDKKEEIKNDEIKNTANISEKNNDNDITKENKEDNKGDNREIAENIHKGNEKEKRSSKYKKKRKSLKENVKVN